jgi:hypothetical protein
MEQLTFSERRRVSMWFKSIMLRTRGFSMFVVMQGTLSVEIGGSIPLIPTILRIKGEVVWRKNASVEGRCQRLKSFSRH